MQPIPTRDNAKNAILNIAMELVDAINTPNIIHNKLTE